MTFFCKIIIIFRRKYRRKGEVAVTDSDIGVLNFGWWQSCFVIDKMEFRAVFLKVVLLFDVCLSVHCRNSGRRKPTRCCTMFYWTCNLLNMFRAHTCSSSGACDCTASIACGVWFLVAGGWKVRYKATGYAFGVRDAVERYPSLRTHSLQRAATDLPTSSNQESHATCWTSSTVASSWWWA
jgi:hypothetical protein